MQMINNYILCHPTIVGKGFVAQQAVDFVGWQWNFFHTNDLPFFSNTNVASSNLV